MDASRTLLELKSTFIRAQVRILSENLEAPEDWRSYATGSEEDELSDKAVQDALQKRESIFYSLSIHSQFQLQLSRASHAAGPVTWLLKTNSSLVNATLKQHNRIIYSSQAIQHVAQQIASLYWSTVNEATRNDGFGSKRVEKTVDLCSHL